MTKSNNITEQQLRYAGLLS